MSFIRNYWQYLTIFIFVILSFYMGFWGHDAFSDIQIILIYSLMALSIHQFEEYVFPGGAPLVINKATYGESKDYQHYPGNSLSIALVNITAYIFYILAIFFPTWIWLGLATMIFNLTQVIGHGYSMNKALKTWYNPGLVSSIVLFLPLSIYYIIFIYTHGLVSIWTWFGAIITFIVIVALTVILPVQSLKSRTSSYSISDYQVQQYNKVIQFAQIKHNN